MIVYSRKCLAYIYITYRSNKIGNIPKMSLILIFKVVLYILYFYLHVNIHNIVTTASS